MRAPASASLTCPECGGTLFWHDLYGSGRFRCRVGHTYSLTGLATGKRQVLEKALWAAVVTLAEQRAATLTDLIEELTVRTEHGRDQAR